MSRNGRLREGRSGSDTIRHVRLLVRPFLLAAAMLLLAGAGARADGPAGADPANNDPLGPMPSSCATQPDGSSCVNAAVFYLDRARARLGQPPYDVPSDFVSLAPDQQALVLTNLDRTLYGLPAITGLTAALDGDAAQGVQADSDPSSSDPHFSSYAANWAGGYPNLPAAYEVWMYDDGPGSGNLACTSTDTSGCWGHRHDVLWSFGGSGFLAMGAAAGLDPQGNPGEAMLLGEGDGSYTPSYTYTWFQAQADGAGTNAYDPGSPQVPVLVTVTAHGPGTVSDQTGTACAGGTCQFEEAQGVPATFTATPGAGASFGGWSGACSGKAACTITPSGPSTVVGATFLSGSGTNASGLPLRVARMTITRHSARFVLGARSTAGLRCGLARAGRHGWTRARWRPCALRVGYGELAPGRYRFIARLGTASVSRRFTVR